MRELVEKSHVLHGMFPWIIEIKTKGHSTRKIGRVMTIDEIERVYSPEDGDFIFELRPLAEFTYTREKGNWYREKTGIGYA